MGFPCLFPDILRLGSPSSTFAKALAQSPVFVHGQSLAICGFLKNLLPPLSTVFTASVVYPEAPGEGETFCF